MSQTTESQLHCTVCQKPISAERASRQSTVCGEKCKNKLAAIRAEQRRGRKCTVCLHPSTPEERELFRAWRAERGDITRAVPLSRDRSLPNKNILRKALREAAGTLEGLLPPPEVSETPGEAGNASSGHSGEIPNLILRLRELSK
jgi:predicted nucleic acid-binding Zn ribbon protein